jgi:hypothetical protein
MQESCATGSVRRFTINEMLINPLKREGWQYEKGGGIAETVRQSTE